MSPLWFDLPVIADNARLIGKPDVRREADAVAAHQEVVAGDPHRALS